MAQTCAKVDQLLSALGVFLITCICCCVRRFFEKKRSNHGKKANVKQGGIDLKVSRLSLSDNTVAF